MLQVLLPVRTASSITSSISSREKRTAKRLARTLLKTERLRTRLQLSLLEEKRLLQELDLTRAQLLGATEATLELEGLEKQLEQLPPLPRQLKAGPRTAPPSPMD